LIWNVEFLKMLKMPFPFKLLLLSPLFTSNSLFSLSVIMNAYHLHLIVT
jgi:hypothetical protein